MQITRSLDFLTKYRWAFAILIGALIFIFNVTVKGCRNQWLSVVGATPIEVRQADSVWFQQQINRIEREAVRKEAERDSSIKELTMMMKVVLSRTGVTGMIQAQESDKFSAAEKQQLRRKKERGVLDIDSTLGVLYDRY